MKIKKELTNTGIYLLFSMVSSGIGFVGFIILTHFFQPQEFGRIGLFFSLQFFIAPLVSLSCNGLIAVNKVTLDSTQYRLFQQTCVGLALIAFMACEMCIFGFWLTGKLPDWLIWIAPLFALTRMLSDMAGAEYLVEQRSITYGLLSVADTCVALCLTILLCIWTPPSAANRIFAMLVGDILLLVVRYWGRVSIFTNPKFRTAYTRPILEFGIPTMLAVAGGWGLNESDKFIIATTRGMEAAGIYTAAAVLAGIMMTFNQSVTNALFPGFFKALAANEQRIRVILFEYMTIFVLLALGFAVIIISGYLLVGTYILPPKYHTVKNLFIALCFSGVAVSVFRPLSLLADYFRLARVKSLAVLLSGGGAFCVIYLGVRKGSLMWAPIGISFGYLLGAVVLITSLMIKGLPNDANKSDSEEISS
jgi:O-antigen/teichoic acid export membrane protein